jgi:hypothetical protein
MELNAFPSSLEVAESDEKPSSDSSKKSEPTYKKRLLSAGKTILDSTRELVGAHPAVKGVLKVLGEVMDLFRGA